jgi:hypothetical protein
MTTPLLPSLAKAHRALIEHQATHQDLFTPTLKKLESTLLALLAGRDPTTLTHADRVAILNSGSLKLLKKLSPHPTPLRGGYQTPGPDSTFILSQSDSYVREALKRGFAMDEDDQIRLFQSSATGDTTRIAKQLQGLPPLTPHGFDRILGHLLRAQPTLPAAYFALGAALLQKSHKAHKKDMDATMRRYAVIYDPALASQTAYQTIAAHALLGTACPPTTMFEHPKVAAYCTALFSPAGRAALKTDLGSLDSWLKKGSPLPKAAQEVEQARTSYRAPTFRRGF